MNSPHANESPALPRDPDNVLLALDRLIERVLTEDTGQKRKNIAILLDYAQYLVPAGDQSGAYGSATQQANEPAKTT